MFSNLFSSGNTIKDVGQAVDSLFTSDEERLTKAEALAKIEASAVAGQVSLNAIDAQSVNFFQSGWRPFVGWVLGFSVAFVLLVNPIIQWVTGEAGPDIPLDFLASVLFGVLGLYGTQRTVEKIMGKTK